jgi:hypothetical protein
MWMFDLKMIKHSIIPLFMQSEEEIITLSDKKVGIAKSGKK